MERYQFILGLLTVGVGIIGLLMTRQRDAQRVAVTRAEAERAAGARALDNIAADLRRALDGVLKVEQWINAFERYEPKRHEELVARIERLEGIVERRESIRRRTGDD